MIISYSSIPQLIPFCLELHSIQQYKKVWLSILNRLYIKHYNATSKTDHKRDIIDQWQPNLGEIFTKVEEVERAKIFFIDFLEDYSLNLIRKD